MLDVVIENNSGRKAPGAEMSALLTPPLEAWGLLLWQPKAKHSPAEADNTENQNQPTKTQKKAQTVCIPLNSCNFSAQYFIFKGIVIHLRKSKKR